MKTGVELITAERQRQINEENLSADHDDKHTSGELICASMAYSVSALGKLAILEYKPEYFWPYLWDKRWFKPRDRISDLVRAGALIAAEIDRLQRMDLDCH